MPDINPGSRLLLGTVGWERPDWLQGYYPDDLPPEWRLAYYANDCGCVVLSAETWALADPERLQDQLHEAQGRLVYFLEAVLPGGPGGANLALFEPYPAVLLVDRPDPLLAGFPQWIDQGPGVWVDVDSPAALLRWSIDSMDMRALRTRAESLGAGVRALVLDGAGADPGGVPRLRALLEMLGRA
ncbi:MAG: hypothetical protein WBN02_18285 [Sedimenticolaceae bacterium]